MFISFESFLEAVNSADADDAAAIAGANAFAGALEAESVTADYFAMALDHYQQNGADFDKQAALEVAEKERAEWLEEFTRLAARAAREFDERGRKLALYELSAFEEAEDGRHDLVAFRAEVNRLSAAVF